MTEAEYAKWIHSITIGACNTWMDYRLIPTERPVVVPPPVKTNYVEVPGADSVLDFTEALDSKIHYGMREGSWTFYVRHEEIPDYNWTTLYSKMLSDFHGKRAQVILNDEIPESGDTPFYIGRVYVDEWASDPARAKITLRYELEPYRYTSTQDAQEHRNGVL